MNVVVFAVHLYKLGLEVNANVGEDGTKTVDGPAVKYPISILCDEDQVNVKLKYAMSTVSNLT
jgi:hypothetical protein